MHEATGDRLAQRVVVGPTERDPSALELDHAARHPLDDRGPYVVETIVRGELAERVGVGRRDQRTVAAHARDRAVPVEHHPEQRDGATVLERRPVQRALDAMVAVARLRAVEIGEPPVGTMRGVMALDAQTGAAVGEGGSEPIAPKRRSPLPHSTFDPACGPPDSDSRGAPPRIG